MRRIAWQQADAVALTAQALDGEFAIDAGDHGLPIACIGGAMHADQVAIEDAVIQHRITLHFQQVIRRRREQAPVKPEPIRGHRVQADVGANRLACGNPAKHGQRQQVCGTARQLQAALAVGRLLQQAVGQQRLHMLAGRIAGGETEVGRHIRKAWHAPGGELAAAISQDGGAL